MKRKYLYIFALVVLVLGAKVKAQNTLSIAPLSVEYKQEIEIAVALTNSDAIVAVQFEIPIPSDFTFVENSVLLNATRSNGHSLLEAVVDGKLKVIIYNGSNHALNESSGELVYFKLKAKTNPGSSTLSLQNVLLSDALNQAVSSTTINGSVMLLAPDIRLSTSSMDYGNVKITTSSIKNFIIYNDGNLDLNVTNITVDNGYYSFSESTFTIAANSSKSIALTFNSTVKGDVSNTIVINSNDPDEATQNIATRVNAYAENNLRMGTFNVKNGESETLWFSIDNMEDFMGFQFDLQVPDEFSYVNNSVQLSTRKDAHTIYAHTLPNGDIRIICYSATGKTFSGSTGDIVGVDLLSNGIGKTYALRIVNPVISGTLGDNILWNSYNNSVRINAPDIAGSSSTSFSPTALDQNESFSYTIRNYGQEELIVSKVSFTDEQLSTVSALPITVDADSTSNLNCKFTPSKRGSLSAQITLTTNDPDEAYFKVAVTGSAFAPNYLSLEDITSNLSDTLWVKVNASNYSDISAFQFDLQIPEFAQCIPSKIKLGTRCAGHTITCYSLNSTSLRVFAYSGSNALLTGNDGVVAQIPFLVNSGSLGTHDMRILNAMLSDASAENLLYGTNDGIITLTDVVTSFSAAEDDVPIQVYPNPAERIITVNTGSEPIKSISILGMDGSVYKICHYKQDQMEVQLKLSDVAAGNYILKIGLKSGKVLKRTIIRN